jgi:hypothetical protein
VDYYIRNSIQTPRKIFCPNIGGCVKTDLVDGRILTGHHPKKVLLRSSALAIDSGNPIAHALSVEHERAGTRRV